MKIMCTGFPGKAILVHHLHALTDAVVPWHLRRGITTSLAHPLLRSLLRQTLNIIQKHNAYSDRRKKGMVASAVKPT